MPSTLKILVYSDNARTRDQVRGALGKRVHPDLPELEYLDVATAPVVVGTLDEGGIDLAILDGEATPVGGLGLAKQLKDEVAHCPPILVLTGRPTTRGWPTGHEPRRPFHTRSTRSAWARPSPACCAPSRRNQPETRWQHAFLAVILTTEVAARSRD